MILSVTVNPSVDRTLFVDSLKPNDANRVTRAEMDAGGKGINAARIVAELGEQVVATGFLGGRTGKFVLHVLNEESVESDFVRVDAETRLNISIEDGSERPPTTFNEAGGAINDSQIKALIAKLDTYLARTAFVTAGGSVQPGIPPNFYARLIRATGGVKTVIDADGELLKSAIEARPFLVKPNADEASRLLSKDVNTLESGLAAAREIRKMGAEIAIVSMGGKGAALASQDGDLIAKPPEIDTNSTIGAGDSMIGGFLVGLRRSEGIEAAFRLGTAAGAATAVTSGSEIGRKHVIESLLPKVIIHRA
jgi:1-phosphofructokinase family hexose kinase